MTSELRSARARALSPDKTVTATMSMIDGMSVAYEPGRAIRHDSESLAAQVKAALAGATSGYRRACELAAEPDARPEHELPELERAIRGYVARAALIEVKATSAKGQVRVKWSGDDFDVRIAAEAVRALGARMLTAEINSAVTAALSERGTRASALFEDELGQYFNRQDQLSRSELKSMGEASGDATDGGLRFLEVARIGVRALDCGAGTDSVVMKASTLLVRTTSHCRRSPP